jgi:hypothetical protein
MAAAAGNRLAVPGQRFFHEEAGERGHKAVIASEILCPLRRGRCEADVPLSACSRGEDRVDSCGQRDYSLRANGNTIDIRALVGVDRQPQAAAPH